MRDKPRRQATLKELCVIIMGSSVRVRLKSEATLR